MKLRIEYPLLLAAAGARRLRRGAIIVPPYLASADDDWRAFESGAQPFTAVIPHTLIWRAAYAWSDRLATHFAQIYRSGHIFNFIAGAVAVLLGLSGLLLPQDKLWLAFTELAVICGFVVTPASAWRATDIAAGSTTGSSPCACARWRPSASSASPSPTCARRRAARAAG